MMINSDLYRQIKEYCELNEISDINSFINKLLTTSFNIEKYGTRPVFESEIIPQPEITEDLINEDVINIEKPKIEPQIITKIELNKERDIYGEN